MVLKIYNYSAHQKILPNSNSSQMLIIYTWTLHFYIVHLTMSNPLPIPKGWDVYMYMYVTANKQYSQQDVKRLIERFG